MDSVDLSHYPKIRGFLDCFGQAPELKTHVENTVKANSRPNAEPSHAVRAWVVENGRKPLEKYWKAIRDAWNIVHLDSDASIDTTPLPENHEIHCLSRFRECFKEEPPPFTRTKQTKKTNTILLPTIHDTAPRNPVKVEIVSRAWGKSRFFWTLDVDHHRFIVKFSGGGAHGGGLWYACKVFHEQPEWMLVAFSEKKPPPPKQDNLAEGEIRGHQPPSIEDAPALDSSSTDSGDQRQQTPIADDAFWDESFGPIAGPQRHATRDPSYEPDKRTVNEMMALYEQAIAPSDQVTANMGQALRSTSEKTNKRQSQMDTPKPMLLKKGLKPTRGSELPRRITDTPQASSDIYEFGAVDGLSQSTPRKRLKTDSVLHEDGGAPSASRRISQNPGATYQPQPRTSSDLASARVINGFEKPGAEISDPHSAFQNPSHRPATSHPSQSRDTPDPSALGDTIIEAEDAQYPRSRSVREVSLELSSWQPPQAATGSRKITQTPNWPEKVKKEQQTSAEPDPSRPSLAPAPLLSTTLTPDQRRRTTFLVRLCPSPRTQVVKLNDESWTSQRMYDEILGAWKIQHETAAEVTVQFPWCPEDNHIILDPSREANFEYMLEQIEDAPSWSEKGDAQSTSRFF